MWLRPFDPGILYFLVGNSFTSVFKIDNSTNILNPFLSSRCCMRYYHDACQSSDFHICLKAQFRQKGSRQPRIVPVGSDSVYDSVRSLIEPLPFIDPDISIINSFFIIKSSNDLIMLHTDIAVPGGISSIRICGAG